MIKELMHDPIFLAGKSVFATKEDLPVAQDLLDTLTAHKDSCVGMAANMIGVILVKTGCLRLYLLSEEGKEITLYRLFAGIPACCPRPA